MLNLRDMSIRSRLNRTSLLLAFLLIAGPMQVEAVFACAMMDVVMHGECCCEEPGACIQSRCGDSEATAGESRCCEHSVTLTYDAERNDDNPSVRQGVIRSGLDPPDPAVLPAPWPAFLAPSTVQLRPFYSARPPPDGLPVYLLTQRLRR